MIGKSPLVANGWKIYLHPLFLDQLDYLNERVEAHRRNDSIGFLKKNATKRLAAILKLLFEVIPQDPARSEYRQGGTLGERHKHWFRARFFQQYRLFFRYNTEAKVIIYGWVNDEDSKRAYDSTNDAYRVFRKMLDSGNPSSDWDSLLAEASAALKRAERVIGAGASHVFREES